MAEGKLKKAIRAFEEEIEGHKVQIKILEPMVDKLRELDKKPDKGEDDAESK